MVIFFLSFSTALPQLSFRCFLFPHGRRGSNEVDRGSVMEAPTGMLFSKVTTDAEANEASEQATICDNFMMGRLIEPGNNHRVDNIFRDRPDHLSCSQIPGNAPVVSATHHKDNSSVLELEFDWLEPGTGSMNHVLSLCQCALIPLDEFARCLVSKLSQASPQALGFVKLSGGAGLC